VRIADVTPLLDKLYYGPPRDFRQGELQNYT
jgi:hypothetical protein